MKKLEEKSLWTSLNNKSKKLETRIDSLYRKRTGSYYTDLNLTDIMMMELVENLKNKKKPLIEYRFFEPCVGSGNFVFSYIKAVNSSGISKEEAKALINNIYVADINKDAINSYKESLKQLAYTYWNIELSDDYFDSHIGSGLLIDVTQNNLDYISIQDIFPNDVIRNGFDIVVTNPPYKNLKAERNQYTNESEYNNDREKYLSIKNIVSKRFKYSNTGVLNLYKLFVEEIIDCYANEEAYISLLIPSSIMSDKSSAKLRTHILNDSNLISVKVIKEGSNYIDAKQALSAILLKKGSKTEYVKIAKNFCDEPQNIANISIFDILNEYTGNAIISVSQEEYEKLKKLRKFPVVKDLEFIVNSRGELDLTSNKNKIIKENTGYPLIRGRNIDYFNLKDNEISEFVNEDFVLNTNKKRYIERERIICQQIVNINKERRITFAYIPSNYVLGNSCNFITVENNEYGIDIFTLLGLFNTSIINWLFKLTSSNNHVNNYEIDNFPIPVKAPELKEISKLVQILLKSKDEKKNKEIIERIELLSQKAYDICETEEMLDKQNNYFVEKYTNAIRYIIPNITDEEASKIFNEEMSIDNFLEGINKFDKNVAEGITYKYKSLSKNLLLNHTTFKLSDLDLEMIKNVPQGGNWKNIPKETVEKSKRLKKITQTGGRTTLYGRIDYEKPSYTITTYFNRPGNGTYVHPIHERVLSVREAARFQGFKDDYFFFGNKTQLLKQVGNAVPTILAYQIAKKIKDITGCTKSIDLFCGAGGMTVGFKAAGIQSLISNDIEESACTTIKINNPEIEVICGDITKDDIKSKIEKYAKIGMAEVICGGPPCQGFSMAGFRAEDDPRNQLFREFVDIVKRVNPKIIVFENVEGLLSHQGGKTYKEIHTLFSELGYKTEGKTLLASEYGVPQKRKRVIIICVRNDLGISPTKLFPTPITEEEEKQVTAKETISDLENIACGDTVKYVNSNESDILKFFRGKVGYDEYVKNKTELEKNLKKAYESEQLSFIDSI